MNEAGFDKQSALEYIQSFAENYTLRYGAPPLCYVHSFGCQQNVSDGEKLTGALVKAGFVPTEALKSAQLIIFNTCAVRENAENRVYGIIGGLKRFKEDNPDVIMGICGCMAQDKSAAKRLMDVYKQIDLVFGTFAYDELYIMLAQILQSRRRILNIDEKISEIDEEFYQLRTSSYLAYVPIMYGCNNFCSYCIVPYVRGRERSRKPQAVIDEVTKLVSEGYKEIFLLGQNVNSYSYGFPQLLRSLNGIDGDFRIRFMSSHPKDASHELIDTIIDCEKVCTHLHLALQSGCDRVLKEMNRKYTSSDYMAIVDYARSRVPDFSFTTDLIVGFPGESYEEFCQTKEFVKKVKFDNIYSFVYSPRSGTKAALLPDEISERQKGLWLHELLLEQADTSTRWLSRFIGKTFRVIPTEKGRQEGMLVGRSDENVIVSFAGGEELIGSFVNVKITGAMNWAVRGEIIE